MEKDCHIEKKRKDEKTQKRETFLHFTVLAYLGYFKSTYNDRVSVFYEKFQNKIESKHPGELNKDNLSEMLQDAYSLKFYLENSFSNIHAEELKYVKGVLRNLESLMGVSRFEGIDVDCLHEIVPTPVVNDVAATHQLAFETLLEAVKKYNPDIIRTEKDFNEQLKTETSHTNHGGNINIVSDLFAQYFSANPLTRLDYYNAMHAQGMEKFLQKLESVVGLPNFASKIPNYFREMVEGVNGKK